MLKRILLVPLVAVLVSGCADGQGQPSLRVMAAVEQKPAGHSELQLILAHPSLMNRRGGVLEVQGQTFKDEGDCQSGDCTRYRADGVWKGQHVGVEVSYFEGGDYFLVTRGDYTAIGSRPISSPSGSRFFTGHHDDREWSPYQGASVWEWEPHPRRLRIVDTDLVMFDSLSGWRGDKCVEFTGARGYNVGVGSIRTFWLAEQNGDWQLSEERPATCE